MPMNAKRWLVALGGLLLLACSAAHAACPARLVTLGGDITETVFALGAGACVVAADSTNQYPAAAAGLPDVGYLRTLNTEGVLAWRPGVILASADAGPPAVIAQFEAAGVDVVTIAEQPTAAGAIAKVRTIARVLGRAAAGERLVASMQAGLATLGKELAKVGTRKRVAFVLTVSGAPLVAGRDTAAAGIIALAGGINVGTAFAGYKPVGAEALLELAPDVIVVMSEGLVAKGGLDAVYALPGVRLTPAGRHHRVVAMDGEFLLGFGPRLAAAAQALARQLYPDAVGGP